MSKVLRSVGRQFNVNTALLAVCAFLIKRDIAQFDAAVTLHQAAIIDLGIRLTKVEASLLYAHPELRGWTAGTNTVSLPK